MMLLFFVTTSLAVFALLGQANAEDADAGKANGSGTSITKPESISIQDDIGDVAADSGKNNYRLFFEEPYEPFSSEKIVVDFGLQIMKMNYRDKLTSMNEEFEEKMKSLINGTRFKHKINSFSFKILGNVFTLVEHVASSKEPLIWRLRLAIASMVVEHSMNAVNDRIGLEQNPGLSPSGIGLWLLEEQTHTNIRADFEEKERQLIDKFAEEYGRAISDHRSLEREFIRSRQSLAKRRSLIWGGD